MPGRPPLGPSPSQQEIPIQPVARPILCKPFEEPTRHWVYDTQTGDAREEVGRRPASYWFKTQRTGTAQLSLLAEEERDDLPLVNLLREDVKRWRRDGEYRNATPVTRQLLAHWCRSDRPRRLFFCQREAVETVMYLNEILAAGKNPGFRPKVSPEDFKSLVAGDKPSFVFEREPKVFPTLADQPNENGLAALTRYGCKMATGSGIVADNTNIAELFYRNISGEESLEVVEDGGEADEEDERSPTRRKARTRTVFGTGHLFPESFANREGFRPTLRIDSRLLAEAESDDVKGSRKEAAEALRRVVDTVGKAGKPGEQVRCVVSVQMLTEGWDANNVTHILGLRAFGSQLLCEQVVGRGLRRMDYTVDPETGLLTEEYVDIYGVPFSVIPFRGRQTNAPAPEDKPKNHVRADEARRHYEIRFPIVEGYAFALRAIAVTANVDAIEKLVLAPDATPTAVFVKLQVGYQVGAPGLGGGFRTATQDRKAYHASTHLQTIEFEITRLVVGALTEGIEGATPKLRLQGRHQLFPQVFRIVDSYVRQRVDFRGCDPCELGLETYVRRIVERLVAAIEPDAEGGEPPLMPRLNRYKPIGTTAEVNFKTTRPCVRTIRSHIDQVVADTNSWEQAAVFRLEHASGVVDFYARNDHLELSVPYEYLGVAHSYFPDFVVRLRNGTTLILEIKGEEKEKDRAKHQAARRWVSAVNHWGQLGHWAFHACRDPQRLSQELTALLAIPSLTPA